MNDREFSAIKLISETLYAAPVIVLIETDETAFSMIEKDQYCVLMAINRYYAESKESIIRMNGDADVIGRAWIFPVDMVVIEQMDSKEQLTSLINTWLPRIASNGIFTFLHYEEEGYEYVKEIVDKKMEAYEQIARAGTLAAYRIVDPTTDISWAMMESAHAKHAVVQ